MYENKRQRVVCCCYKSSTTDRIRCGCCPCFDMISDTTRSRVFNFALFTFTFLILLNGLLHQLSLGEDYTNLALLKYTDGSINDIIELLGAYSDQGNATRINDIVQSSVALMTAVPLLWSHSIFSHSVHIILGFLGSLGLATYWMLNLVALYTKLTQVKASVVLYFVWTPAIITLATAISTIVMTLVSMWEFVAVCIFKSDNEGFEQKKLKNYRNLVKRLMTPIHRTTILTNKYGKKKHVIQSEETLPLISHKINANPEEDITSKEDGEYMLYDDLVGINDNDDNDAECFSTIKSDIYSAFVNLFNTIKKIPKYIKDYFKEDIDPHSIFELQTDFYYPQRLIIAFCASACLLFAMTQGAVTVALLIPSLYSTIVLPILNAFDLTFPIMNQLPDIIQYGGIGIALFTLMISLINWYLTFRNYRREIFNLRKGTFDKEILTSTIPQASSYIGYQLSGSCFSFFIMAFVFVLFGLFIVVLVASEYVRVRIWNLISVPLLSWILKFIVNKIVYYIVVKDTIWFRYPQTFRTFDTIDTFLSSVIGVAVSLQRLLLALLSTAINFGRLDVCVQARGWDKFDSSHQSYLAMMVLDHCHSNPVVLTAIDLMLKIIKERRTLTTKEKLRRKFNTKLWLWILLSKNPSLRKDRKQTIQKKKNLIEKVVLGNSNEKVPTKTNHNKDAKPAPIMKSVADNDSDNDDIVNDNGNESYVKVDDSDSNTIELTEEQKAKQQTGTSPKQDKDQ